MEAVLRSGRRTILLFIVLGFVPLALLTWSAMSVAEDSVRDEVMTRVRSSSEMSSSFVELEMTSVGELVESYASRPNLVDAIGSGERESYDIDVVDQQVAELVASRPGLRTAFLADAECTAWSAWPPVPEAIGENFLFRDWCRGLLDSDDTYVSEAFDTVAADAPRVVMVTAPVRSDDGTMIAMIGVSYDLGEIQRFVEEIEAEQGISVNIVDQRGTILGATTAETAGGDHELYSRQNDPILVNAFDGIPGITRTTADGDDLVVATTPITGPGWIAESRVSADEAFAGVSALRNTVLRITLGLAVVLVASAWFVGRALRLRRSAEDAVRISEARMQSILASASDGYIALDENGIVTEWNTAAHQLFGWAPHEAIGRDLAELVVPEQHREAFAAGIRRFLRSRTSPILDRRVVVEAVDRDGVTVHVELAATAVESDGRWSFNAFVHDISDRTRRRAELIAARDAAVAESALKSDFLVSMSHEMRTPMNGVLGMTALLLDSNLDPAQREDAETVRQSGEALLAIIDDVLDFSRIDAGHVDVEVAGVSTRRLVEDAIERVSGRATDKGVGLSLDIHPEVPEFVECDPARIRQVLTNIVGSALEFTERGAVAVSVGLDGAERVEGSTAVLRFEVADTGIGLTADERNAIFQTFTRSDVSVSRRVRGTGLGLAIAKRLVDLMQGSIGAESVSGEGSLVWFTVPMTISQTAGEPKSVEAAPSDTLRAGSPRGLQGGASARGRILLAEDNEVHQRVASRMLDALGYSYHVVSNGAQAVNAAVTWSFDAILMDLQMSEVDGFEAARLLRAAEGPDERTPIVAVTASAKERDRIRCLDAGMDDHLAKPLRRAELAAVLDRLLGEPRPQDCPAPVEAAQRPADDLRTSIASRLDELYDGLDIDSDSERARLLRSFLNRSTGSIDEIESASEAGDADLVQYHAHTLAGMAGNVGASTIASLAADAEDAAVEGRMSELGEVCHDLRTAHREVERVVDDIAPSLESLG